MDTTWRTITTTLRLLVVSILLLFPRFGFAQEPQVDRWIELESGYKFHITQLKEQRVDYQHINDFVRNYFRLRPNHNFSERKRIADDSGDLHIRYSHLLDSNRVYGSEVIAHFHNGLLYAINGVLFLPESTEPGIRNFVARMAAIEKSGAKTFKWDDPQEEALLKIWTNNPQASYYPEGELVYCPKDLDFSNPFALCYRFDIYSDDPLMRRNFFIRASDGTLWAEEDLLHETNVQGSANTKYRGVKPIMTDSTAPGSYRLRETTRGNGIETYNMKTGTSYGASVDFTDGDNYWNNYNLQFDEVAGDAHFGAEMTYDFYQTLFNRNSYDNNGTKIRSYVHYRSKYSNAFWNGSVMTYGDGNGTSVTPLTSLDICGHEITHAVTTSSAALIYKNESGALNESFSDIFGNAIEYFADSSQFSWRMGEDIMSSGNGIRNMANPKTHGDPSTYKGQYWYSSTGDNGGVHTNSGVQNFWFYLLSEGKSGTNDNGDSYNIDSLGIFDAQRIAYRNLTVYLTASSDYEEARYYGIQAAADLFGDCSKEMETTTNAWYAVGVGDAYDSSLVVADFSADTAYCTSAELVQFTNKSKNARKFKWDFGDNQSSNQRNPAHAYPGQGSFTVKLIAEGCYNGVLDSIEKKSYIQIDSTRDICDGYLLPKGGKAQVHACKGFVYDHNGDKNYDGLSRDTLTIDFAVSDSAQITFMEMDYEDGYDSIYVYDGNSTTGTLLGGFTGSGLPFGGKPKTINSGAITITHFSDPYVVGTGFKAKFEAFRPPISLVRTPDTTLCYNQVITISALGKGGSGNDHAYYWNGTKGNRFQTLTAKKDTILYLVFADECMEEYIYDTIRIHVLDPITAVQSNDTTLCQGNKTDLFVTPSGGKGSYTFFTSEGNTYGPASDLQITTPYLEPGTYKYWIAYTDGCTISNDTAFYTVQVSDSLDLWASNDTTLCYGTSAMLTARATGGNGLYQYNWGLGKTSNPNLAVTPLKTKQYTVRLSDNCSSYEPSEQVLVTVLDTLSVRIVAQDTACYGETVQINSVVTGGMSSQYKYAWSPIVSDATSISLVTRMDTTIGLTVSDGCTPWSGSSSASIHVRAPLSVTLPADTEICLGEKTTVTATVSGGITANQVLTWSHGLGTGTTKELSPNTTTTYNVTLEDQCSDPATGSYTVTVKPLPDVDFTVSSIPNCTGIEITFNEQSDALNPSQFFWSFGDGATGTGRTVKHTYSSAWTYNVSLKVENEYNCIDSLIKSNFVEIQEHPVASFYYTPTKLSFLNKTVNFTNESSFHTTSEWSFGDGTLRDLENPEYTYYDTGSFTVTLRVENSIGCWDDTSQTLRIDDEFVLYIPNVFDPNLDQLNDEWGIYIRGVKEYKLSVFNRFGQVMWESSPAETHWDGTFLDEPVPLGFYFYRLTYTAMDGTEHEETGKFNLIR